jgi:peptide/nickel transport system substrate-binding protein
MKEERRMDSIDRPGHHSVIALSRRAFLRRAGLFAGMSLLAACAPAPAAPPAKEAPPAREAPKAAPAAPAAGSGAAAVKPAEQTPATAPAKPAAEQRLIIGAGSEASHLDPMRSNDSASQYAYNLIYDRLVTLDEKLQPAPAAAESWEVSPDGTAYTFKLRKGIKFHDGSDLTAEDVKFSFDRILDPKNASDKRSFISMVKQVDVVDPGTVRMTLDAPYAPFIFQARQHILPRAAVEKVGDDFTRRPVGSGPFKFVEWNTNDRLVLARNDGYWLARPNLAQVVLKPIPDRAVAASNLLAGDVDVIEAVNAASFAQLQANPNVQVLSVPTPNYQWIGFAQMGHQAPFNDKRFRQAVYNALDVDGLAKALFPQQELGIRAYATLTPEWWPGGDYEAMRALALKKDPARAKQLFEELVRDGVMPADYTVRMIVNQGDRQRSGEVVVTSLKAIGRPAEVQVMEFGAYLERLRKKEEALLYMLSTIPQAPDPDASLHWLFFSKGTHGGFLGLPSDTELDQQILKARASSNKGEREKIYDDVMRHVIGDVYHIPISFQNIVVAHSGRVQGLKPSPLWDWNLTTAFTNVQVT